MKKTLLLFVAVLMAVGANAQISMIANQADTTDGINIQFITGVEGQIMYKANGNYYEYNAQMFGNWQLRRTYETEFYVTDGTAEGIRFYDMDSTTKVAVDGLTEENYTQLNSSRPNYPFVYKGEIYFWAGNGNGSATYKLDKTTGDTVFVTENQMKYTLVDGDYVYYTPTSPASRPIVRWDGAEKHDTLPNQLGVIHKVNNYAKLGDIFVIDGRIDALDSLGNQELVLYNSVDGSSEVVDLYKASGQQSRPSFFVNAGDKVYFKAKTDGGTTGLNAIFETDGTVEGTKLVAGGENSWALSSDYKFAQSALGYLDGYIFFSTKDSTTGAVVQMYSQNVATGDFKQLSNNEKDFTAKEFVAYDGWLYMSVYNSADYTTKLYMVNSDTLILVDENVEDVAHMTLIGDKIYFEGNMMDAVELADGSMGESGKELMVYSPMTTSITRVRANQALDVYPNPTNGVINISNNVSEMATYELFDLSGKNVSRGYVGNGRLDLDVNAGIYMLRVVDGNELMVNKVIVK